jgi:hypothetical protein
MGSDAAQNYCEAHLDDQVKTQTANDGIPSSAGPENQPSRRPRPSARPCHATNATQRHPAFETSARELTGITRERIPASTVES